MNPDHLQELRDLLETQRVLALSLLVSGEPHVGLLPYAMTPDYRAVLVHASDLARHSRGLQPGAHFSALIHKPDGPDIDPLQIPRLTLHGVVQPIDRGTDAYRDGQRLFTRRFPSSEPTFSLGDFRLYRLQLERGRYVGGFAQAISLTAEDLRQLASIA
jgi:putative heme iron utilization protein